MNIIVCYFEIDSILTLISNYHTVHSLLVITCNSKHYYNSSSETHDEDGYYNTILFFKWYYNNDFNELTRKCSQSDKVLYLIYLDLKKKKSQRRYIKIFRFFSFLAQKEKKKYVGKCCNFCF